MTHEIISNSKWHIGLVTIRGQIYVALFMKNEILWNYPISWESGRQILVYFCPISFFLAVWLKLSMNEPNFPMANVINSVLLGTDKIFFYLLISFTVWISFYSRNMPLNLPKIRFDKNSLNILTIACDCLFRP